jgi:hypothetical protein
MAFDPRAIFANLTEKERLYGHHSAEGRALRLLSRSLNGWLERNLSKADVIASCEQAIEDWLKARLDISAWSAIGLTGLLVTALRRDLITSGESHCLQTVHSWRAQPDALAVTDIETALQWCIEIIERHWS